MDFTVFYSWQSDRPKEVNRFFIKDAVEAAIKRINKNFKVDDAYLCIDHDTKDVKGIPEIIRTILKKIDNSSIYLADITYIAKTTPQDERPAKAVHNPNVMFELGYALKVIGEEHIITVMNEAFGMAEKKTKKNKPLEAINPSSPVYKKHCETYSFKTHSAFCREYNQHFLAIFAL